MPKALITQAFLDTFKCPPGKSKIEVFDTLIPSFTFERRASGHGTYYVRYSAAGIQRQLKVCCEHDAPCSQVRKKAAQLRADAILGGDPSAKKAEAKAIPLYRQIAGQYLAYAKLHLRAHDSVEMNLRVHLLPKWAKMRVTDITRTAVAQWLAEKRAGGLAPATVEKLRVMLGRSFDLASQAGVQGCEKNPARGIRRKPLNNARDRFLSVDEAARLRAAVAASQNTQLQHIVGLLLLTGARLRELLDARWENVDVDRQSWFIPDSKTGKSRYVPLSKPAVTIVTALPRFKGCPWLVPNPDTLKPFVSIKHGWQKAIKTAKLPGLRIHDLRHSAASFMVNSGVDLFAVGKVLGHASYQSTQRYAHLAQDTLLAAVEAGAAKQVG
jgi:integrase